MASLYTSLVSNLAFPLQECLKGHTTIAVRKQLEQSQWWSRDRLEAWRLSRLGLLLEHAYQYVPYYRNLFARTGVLPSDIRSVADLAKIPFLTKSDIRAHSAQLKSERAQRLSRFNTGGSSGEPLVFYIGAERVSHDVAAKWRATRWWGVDIGDPEIVVWGSPIELDTQDRLRGIRDRLMRTRLLPAFEMSESKLDSFVETIRLMRPRMLFGYPSALFHIAQHASRRATQLDKLGIQVAFVTAELLHDSQRSAIERIFGCRVANGYGGRDAGFLAHECPAGGMHITAEDVIIEIVDESGHILPAGMGGEVVVTHLATKDYPFIRYKTGDVAVIDDSVCPCGRGLPLVKEIQGRTTDFVVAKDGTVMHGLALIYVVRDVPGIKQFRIEQESLDRTMVYVVPDEGFASDAQRVIRTGMQARLGASVDIVVNTVTDIPREKSGKFRYIVSHVRPESRIEERLA